jgi:adenosyl cobinamide kinase/adenosyl cobinamide phosphate guanylyltransferase
MAERIARHRADRAERWQTVEAPTDITGALGGLPTDAAVCVIDCLTLWLTNMMLDGRDIAAETDALAAALEARTLPVVLVSNEVGLGIVPEHELARRFRDEAGRLHQRLAAMADRVILMTAGLPLQVKPPPGA